MFLRLTPTDVKNLINILNELIRLDLIILKADPNSVVLDGRKLSKVINSRVALCNKIRTQFNRFHKSSLEKIDG